MTIGSDTRQVDGAVGPAVETIGITSMSTSVRRLVDLLGDADADIRLRAALELGEDRRAEAAAALVERFGRERDFAVREMLTWAVLRVRAAALPLVREALGSHRWLARLQATHTLSKVADPGDAERLIPLVGDPVDVVAARAYWAVAQCGDPVAIPALIAELSRGSAEHRNSLLVALCSFGAAAVPALRGAVRHGGVPQVRSHAADTLAYLGSPVADPAIDVLVDAARDADEDVRLAAVNALGQLTLPTAWEVIDEFAASEPSRLGVLARRLTERRPSARAMRMAQGRADGAVEVVGDDHVPRSAPRHRWPTPDLGLVTCEGGPMADELAPKLALQVEFCRPQCLSRAEVPEAVLGTVRVDAYQQARAQGRTDAMAERIAAGAVEQFVHDHVFLEQVSVADPGAIVKDLLFGTEVRITAFVRLETDTTRSH